jgi:hypothetical protein
MSYLESLDQELAAAGIPGRRRARIVAEFADHLECDPQAQLGEPKALAQQFADELGTVLARRAAFVAFAALALAGLLLAIGLLRGQGRFFASASSARPVLGDIGAWFTVLGAQVAFAAGVLAAVRAFRRRQAGVVPREEAVILVRRAAVGLGAGLATMVGFGLSALALRDHVAGSWVTLALSLSGAAIVILLATAPVVLTAARLRPVAAGSAGDLYEDFGPLVPRPLQGNPWTLAITLAVAIAIVLTVVGIVKADGYDGALRGIADGLACLIGFGLLGRYLGLRRLSA